MVITVSSSFSRVAGAVLALGLLCCGGAARADEFSTVPIGDAAYTQLMTVGQAGWIDELPDARRAHRSERDVSLTRYEISLQVARAVISVTARADANPHWAVSRTALGALRDLTAGFQPELKALGVDVIASQKRLDKLMHNATSAPPRAAAQPASSSRSGAAALPIGLPTATRRLPMPTWLPISQRLRVSTAVSVLSRDADDLFGDAAFGPEGGLARKGSVYVPGALPVHAGLAVGVTDWLTLRANYASLHRIAPAAIPSLLQSSRFNPGNDVRSLKGGVDFNLTRGVTFSGDVENITGTQPGAGSLTRLGTGLGWTGWQNRLSLKANMSRLIPDDTRVLPSTLMGLNLGVDVSERLSLTLQYQKMFAAPDSSDPNRLVAGGVSLNF